MPVELQQITNILIAGNIRWHP